METRIKILLDSNPLYKNYIRNNSYWYKILNRDPNMFNSFIEEVKEKYKLRPTDKINNMVDKIDMISKFINVLR